MVTRTTNQSAMKEEQWGALFVAPINLVHTQEATDIVGDWQVSGQKE